MSHTENGLSLLWALGLCAAQVMYTRPAEMRICSMLRRIQESHGSDYIYLTSVCLYMGLHYTLYS